jgi:hypothetical protein
VLNPQQQQALTQNGTDPFDPTKPKPDQQQNEQNKNPDQSKNPDQAKQQGEVNSTTDALKPAGPDDNPDNKIDQGPTKDSSRAYTGGTGKGFGVGGGLIGLLESLPARQFPALWGLPAVRPDAGGGFGAGTGCCRCGIGGDKRGDGNRLAGLTGPSATPVRSQASVFKDCWRRSALTIHLLPIRRRVCSANWPAVLRRFIRQAKTLRGYAGSVEAARQQHCWCYAAAGSKSRQFADGVHRKHAQQRRGRAARSVKTSAAR